MRFQIRFNVISLFFFVLLTSFSTLKAEQIELTSTVTKESLATSKPYETAKHDSAEAAKVVAIRASLVGKWESPNFMLEGGNARRDTNGSSLKYHFRNDGTYSKTLGGAEVQIEEEGTWSLSEDCTQLTMQSKTLCAGQLVTTVATIKYLAMDELVLEQTLCVAGMVVSAKPKSLYFNKY